MCVVLGGTATSTILPLNNRVRRESNLGIDVRDVFRLIDQGQLVGYRFGLVIGLRSEDVDCYPGDGGEGQ